jgi:hypothetical protein
MKIKLSELRQLIKSVIKEQVLNEMDQYPPMGGATKLFIENGFAVESYTKKRPVIITFKRDDVTVIIKSDIYTGYTIQVNTKEKPNGKIWKFNTIDDTNFGLATMLLYLEPVK